MSSFRKTSFPVRISFFRLEFSLAFGGWVEFSVGGSGFLYFEGFACFCLVVFSTVFLTVFSTVFSKVFSTVSI